MFKKERSYQNKNICCENSCFDLHTQSNRRMIESVYDFLAAIEDERLYKYLSEDEVLLKALYLKICGYSYKEAADLLHVKDHAIYNKIEKIKKKI